MTAGEVTGRGVPAGPSPEPGQDGLLVVDQLVKRYPKRPSNAVDGLSFTVRRGELFGLLGPNGAGKTTTIGVLTTRVRPTGGRALVDGVWPPAVLTGGPRGQTA